MSDDAVRRKLEDIQDATKELNEAVRHQNELFKTHAAEDHAVAEKHIEMLQKVSEQVQDTQESVIKLDNKLDLNIQKIEYELKAINELDGRQNAMLDEHMKRTALAEERIAELEEPKKAIKKLVEWSKWIMAIAGGIAVLSSILG